MSLFVISALILLLTPHVQGRPDKPDIRVCRLPDIKRKMNNRRASVKDGGEAAWGSGGGPAAHACQGWQCGALDPATKGADLT